MARARSPWRGALRWALAAVPLLWILGWLVGSPIAARLCAASQRRLAARVEIGGLRYLPPYWVVAHDVVVSSELDGDRVDWITLPSLHASLPWLPSGSRPLEELTLQDPSVTVVRTADGVHDVLELWRADPAQQATLPVQQLRVAGARLAIVDRTAQPARAEPIRIGGFTVQVDAADETRGTFTYQVGGGDAVLAITSDGTLDPGQRTLDVARLDARVSLAVSGSDASPSAAGAELRDVTARVDLARRTAQLTGGTIALGRAAPLLVEDVRASVTLAAGRIDASDVTARVASGDVSAVLAVRWAKNPAGRSRGARRSST